MSDITFIGLGLMGASLARALHRAGVDLTVWNRSPAKMQPFVDAGVPTAPDLASAVRASPAIILCVNNYPVTKAMLETDGIAFLLAGRTVVQLSTGTPKEARDMAEWVHAHNARYLDGAILAGPAKIDTGNGEVLLCGDASANEQAGKALANLAGTVRYLGTNVGAAATLDLAWLTLWYGQFIATIHAAKMCQAEGVGLDALIPLFPDNPLIQHDLTTIHEESYDNPYATLEVWGAALKRVQQQARDAGISPDIPDFVASYFEKAVDAGFGQKKAMAMFKIL